jgi:Acetyltransferase (GNAT) domain
LDNKNKYRIFCEKEESIPIFSKDWWLDAIVGEDNWDIVLVEKGEQIIASLPYVKKQKLFFDYISMPTLTKMSGIWIKYPNGQKYVNKLSFEKKVINEIITKLPRVDYFSQNFHHSFTNWLPFYWNGFNQTTRYTYLLEDLTDHDKIFAGFKENIKTDIRKAKKKVKVYTSDSIEEFFEINKKTFDRQNIKIPYNLSLLKKIDTICKKNNCRKIFFASDEEQNIHSAVYIIWDSQSAYYLMGGGDPLYRNSGATSLLLWETIKFSSTVTKSFDFEGSMIHSIERFFSGFGAVQKPFFKIYKTNSKLLKIKDGIIEVIK